MPKEVQLQIEGNGDVTFIYDDAVVKALQPEKIAVRRASHVEWEDIGGRSGWTVRSCHDPELAVRATKGGQKIKVSKIGDVVVHNTRESALRTERRFVWDLISEQ